MLWRVWRVLLLLLPHLLLLHRRLLLLLLLLLVHLWVLPSHHLHQQTRQRNGSCRGKGCSWCCRVPMRYHWSPQQNRSRRSSRTSSHYLSQQQPSRRTPSLCGRTCWVWSVAHAQSSIPQPPSSSSRYSHGSCQWQRRQQQLSLVWSATLQNSPRCPSAAAGPLAHRSYS
jgi:hypothetical protein